MVDEYRLSDYELTDKGKDFLEGNIDPGPYGSKKYESSTRLMEALDTIDTKRGTGVIFKESLAVKRLMPKLEKLGFIEKVSLDTIDSLISSLPEGIIKKDLDIYTRLARGEPVSDSEVDLLFGRLKTNVEANLVEYILSTRGEFGSRQPSISFNVSTFRNTVEGAQSRSDKVIAIDSAMSLVHAEQSLAIPLFGWYPLDKEGDPSPLSETEEGLVDKVLTRLFEDR